MKNENGSTLIAVIMAILVLIILAAISVSLVMSDIENEKQESKKQIVNYYDEDEDIIDTENTTILESEENVSNVVANVLDNNVVKNENTVSMNLVNEQNVVE